MTTTTANSTVAVTRSGRPKVPVLDMAAIQADAERFVASITENAKTEDDLFKAVINADADARAVLSEWEPYMVSLALSLNIHEGARAVNRAIGVNREAFSKRVAAALNDWTDRPASWDATVSRRGTECGVRFYSRAVTELPPVAEKVMRAKQVRALLRPIRNNLIQSLTNQGVTRRELAEKIGMTPSRVSHIVTGRDDMPRKKPKRPKKD